MSKKYKKYPPVRKIDKMLHRACWDLSPSQMEEAILEGADVNAPDYKQRYAPIDMVTTSATNVSWEEYISDLRRQEKIHKAIDLLLEFGAAPDGITGDFTPLFTFAWLYWDPYVVKKLCKAGANVNAFHRGETILDWMGMESIFLEYNRDEKSLEQLWRIENMLSYFGAKTRLELLEEAKHQHGVDSD